MTFASASMNSQVQTALDDVKAAAAEIDAAVGPWSSMIPSTIAAEIEAIRAKLNDAVSRLATALTIP